MIHHAGSNGFIWYDEQAILRREQLVAQLALDVRDTFYRINPAIHMFRVETPCLIPPDATTHLARYKVDERYVLRAESTAGTYMVMRKLMLRPPVILWQVNKSFRDEPSEAMRPSHFRYREFYQCEFQLFYTPDTRADYHTMFVERFPENWGRPVPLPPDELPPYSTRTTDLMYSSVEIASLSNRNDFDMPVFEMSFGLDRLTVLSSEDGAGVR